ncbi:LacI family transcriptional regulator [Nakamurella endophytica]|uniref:LacI family transcriptional regulator n=1 Tax=Nakamurella endophytica TaxID=1748367 RepID=A0A917SVC1_9ACTN|nr:LacI family transcriptional regulator [Nakamurella endophytica]
MSRVVNGDRYVSAEVRTRVEQAIADLQYVPDMLARTFRTGRDRAIGVAVPDIADAFFGAVVQSVAEHARMAGSAVLVTTLGGDADLERPAVESLLRRHVTGLLLAPTAADQSYLRPWQEHTEVVFVDRPPRRAVADSVVEDDFGGAGTAVRHLVEQGHRRVAFVGRGRSVATTARRLEGYRSALAEAGLPADPDLERPLDGPQAATATEVLDALLGLHRPPTAIFSSDSLTSQAVLAQLHRRARTDLAFVSFGDFPMAAALRPSVTVVDQDPAALGRVAAERLFQRIESPGRRLKRQLVLPVTLVVRESSQVPVPASRPAG